MRKKERHDDGYQRAKQRREMISESTNTAVMLRVTMCARGVAGMLS